MANSFNAPVVISQAKKRTHAVISSSETSSQHNSCVEPVESEERRRKTKPAAESKSAEPSAVSISNSTGKNPTTYPSDVSNDLVKKGSAASKDRDAVKQPQNPCNTTKPNGETNSVETKVISNGTTEGKSSVVNISNNKEIMKVKEHVPSSSALTLSSHLASETRLTGAIRAVKSTPEPMETSVATASQDITDQIETASSLSKPSGKITNNISKLEDGEEPEKKLKVMSASNNGAENGKTPEQILEYMDKTFEQRRKVVTKQMPTIPELQELYPDLFSGKQLLLEFQRITKIDIDQKIQEFCVRYALAVIELARDKKEAASVLARWEQAKQENDALKQYWDMVTALCLLPLHFGENFVEMVVEIGEDDEVVPQGKIVPTLVARGNIFCTDEFFLIAENTIVQEFEEFTIAFASLYSSYWVFNMVYPETIENTYNYIQRCIVRQREPGALPVACKNFTKTLLKWNKGKD